MILKFDWVRVEGSEWWHLRCDGVVVCLAPGTQHQWKEFDAVEAGLVCPACREFCREIGALLEPARDRLKSMSGGQ